MLKQQEFSPRAQEMSRAYSLKDFRIGAPHHAPLDPSRDVARSFRYESDTFMLLVGESQFQEDNAFYTVQGDYIKFHFRLAGRNTTILDGHGEYESDRPGVFVTACPQETVKIDLLHGGERYTMANVCVLRDFFPDFLGIEPAALPSPIKDIVMPDEMPFALHSFPMTPDLAMATRGLFSQSELGTFSDLYYHAKVTEMMCLLVSSIHTGNANPTIEPFSKRVVGRLHEAKEFLAQRYCDPLTLAQIARQVGLNKTTLASGFSHVFGMTVFEFLQKERMQRAYDMLRDREHTITEIAEAVGYNHTCNFSTAFRKHFGESPKEVRATLSNRSAYAG